MFGSDGGEGRGMNCIQCGKEAQCVRENSGYRESHLAEFGIQIPYVEVWICKECNTGWSYREGVLSVVGKAWHTFAESEIPTGALAVLGEDVL